MVNTDYSYITRGCFGPKPPAAVGRDRLTGGYFLRTRRSWERIDRDEAEALLASLKDLLEPVPYEVV